MPFKCLRCAKQFDPSEMSDTLNDYEPPRVYQTPEQRGRDAEPEWRCDKCGGEVVFFAFFEEEIIDDDCG